MTQVQETQLPPSTPEPARRWILVETAPGWFRRVWTERSREVPKPQDTASSATRRIAYL